MYEIGDMVIYGDSGVCSVEGISTPDLPGVDKDRKYYVLKPLYQAGTIYAPIDGMKVFIRPVISAEEADRLIDLIPTVSAQAYHSEKLHELSEHYRSALSTHDCADLIELLMSIYSKKQTLARQRQKFGQTDERFMKRAEELLYGEFAVALGIAKTEVPKYISSRVERFSSEG